jgi:hypothetical protein
LQIELKIKRKKIENILKEKTKEKEKVFEEENILNNINFINQ